MTVKNQLKSTENIVENIILRIHNNFYNFKHIRDTSN